jgi:phosphoserine phosphatase RsbU/P
MISRVGFRAGDPALAQLRRLTEISRALTYTTSLDQVTRLTVERGAELLDANAAVLMLPDAEGLLHVRASHGVTADRVNRFSAPLSDDVLPRLQGLLAVDDDYFIAVPLVVGGAVTGILAVSTKQVTTAGDESLLSALADHAAVALENARLAGEVRTEMEDRLRASEGATDAKDRALATLAHDIRTPLGAISGYCEILVGEMLGPITDRQREAIGHIRMSGSHLLSLLDNVMDMARLNAGVLRVDLEPMPLIEVARESMQMLLPAAEARLQKITLASTGSVMVTGDYSQLRQVLVNLMGNAVKFTPPNGTIRIEIASDTVAGEPVGTIRVSDSGPGIALSEQTAIFEPYYRSMGTAHEPGVGLGLAISHAIMKRMNGDLTVESQPGHGATFTVRLPLA